MPTDKEAIEIFGEDLWKKMCASGWLDGITVVLLPNGETDIPESDLLRAYRAARGGSIHPLEWD